MRQRRQRGPWLATGLALVVVVACTSTANLSGGGTNSPCGDTASDPKNCGACGNVCNFANAAATCVNGTCVMGLCNDGYRDCSGGPSNGCETYVLGGDPEHCGSCEGKCNFAHAAATCAQGGTCKMGACADGYADCNNSASDGCEVQTGGGDTKNCGACGKTCLVGQKCAGSGGGGSCAENEVACNTPGVACKQQSCFVAGRYSVTANIVVDRTTGRRLWQRNVNTAATYSQANVFCSGLNLENIQGWRLPTYGELSALLYQAGGIQGCPTCAPATDQAAFPNVPIDGESLWTTTAGSPSTYETTNFCDGRMNYEANITDPHPYRCTHDPL